MRLPVPVTPADLLGITRDALLCFPEPMQSASAALVSVATALQETGGRTRVQLPSGAGRGFWQQQQNFIADVASNPASARLYVHVCERLGVPQAPRKLYGRLTSNDTLGAALFRLGLWCDPAPLPAVGDINGAWDLYVRVQQPGKPSRDRWSIVYPQALAALRA